MEETKCAFCSEPSTDIIQVTDSDGIQHPMCRECLEHPDSDVICQCGVADFIKEEDGFVRCKYCKILLEENSFYYIGWSMRKMKENYKQKMLEYKEDSELCDIIFKLIRAEFDKVGTQIPSHPYLTLELLKLTQAAKRLVIGRAIIDRGKVKEMGNDINI